VPKELPDDAIRLLRRLASNKGRNELLSLCPEIESIFGRFDFRTTSDNNIRSPGSVTFTFHEGAVL